MANCPQLFRLGHPLANTSVFPPSFATPLGRLVLELEVEGSSIPPVAVFVVGVRSVTVWSVPVQFEMLLTPAPVSLPPGMAVAGAWAAVWRLSATTKSQSAVSRSAVIKCLWASGASWSGVEPETGENLDAQTWADGRTRVTVGLPEYETATTYRRDGFEVAVGSVRGGQGHFVCAWGPDAPGDISTWFAVDWPTARLVPSEDETGTTPPPAGL